MIIQAGLIFILAILAIYALSQQKRSPIVGGLILCIAALGIGLVLFPETATYIANLVGVGRGADLIFYLFIVVALVAIFNLHLRIRAISEVATELARSIALITARRPGRE
jgi:small membrane protein